MKRGDRAIHKLTEEEVLILDVIEDTTPSSDKIAVPESIKKQKNFYTPGYIIRTKNYLVVNVGEFELEE